MKKDYNISFLLLLFIFFAISCEPIDDLGSDGYTISKLEGQWKCDENSQNFKKSTMEIYYVYISPHPSDTTKVILSNFYQLGDNVEVVAKLSGQTLTLSP